MRTERHRQRDLFESDRPLPKIAPDLRTKIVKLVRALLIEATNGRASAAVARTCGRRRRTRPGRRSRKCGPRTCGQRCWVHKTANVLNNLAEEPAIESQARAAGSLDG